MSGAPASGERRYRLRSGVGHCRFNDRTIVLDVAADRYWQLGAAAADLLDRLSAADAAGASDLMVGPLVRLGLVEVLDQANMTRLPRHATTMPPPADSALEHDMPASKLSLLRRGEIVMAALLARLMVRLLPLRWIVRRVSRQSPNPPGETDDAINQLAREFAAVRKLLPLAPLCLPDSIAFLRFVQRRGHFPRLVFGVEAYPFAAHCWVQQGDVVLTDAVEHARLFKPILVI